MRRRAWRSCAGRAAFALLAQVDEVDLLVRRARNALRRGRPDEAAALLEPKLASDAPEVAPYLASAWRLRDPERWRWLEGDPRLVSVVDLELPAGLAERARALHVAVAEPLHQSVRGGTQTEGHLLARIEPEFRALRDLLAEAVARHIAQLPPFDPTHPTLGKRRDAPVRFAASWSVRLIDGGCHANHFHPEGWFSSALYLAVPPPGEAQAGWLVLGEPQAELGLDLAPIRTIEPGLLSGAFLDDVARHPPFAAGERPTIVSRRAPRRGDTGATVARRSRAARRREAGSDASRRRGRHPTTPGCSRRSACSIARRRPRPGVVATLDRA